MAKTDGLKRGDRVRISFEAVVQSAGGSLAFTIVDGEGTNLFSEKELATDTFAIEKIEPPIAVGDEVEWTVVHMNGDTRRTGRVLALAEGYAMVACRQSGAIPQVVDVRLLRRG